MEGSTVSPAHAGRPGRFAAGARIDGRYAVQRLLGRGGMGEVYQVVDAHLGEAVALKTLSERLADDPDALPRFQAEVRNARRIGHPNVCRTFDFGVHTDERGTTHFLTMELLAGETLDERLERGPIGRAELLPIVEQLASAIDAAHQTGVVHRDLKPSNVMLVPAAGGGPPRAVITDFGLSRRVGDPRATEEGWVGTPSYVAPEQLEGDAGGPAVDLYAFGVILFRAVTGRLPFDGSPIEQRLARPAQPASAVDPKVPPAWDRAIARCLERRPEDRFGSAGEAIAALRSDSRTSRSRAALRLTRRWTVVRKRTPWIAIAIAAAVSAAAGAVALVAWNRSRSGGHRPGDCGMPDLRDGWSAQLAADWCREGGRGVHACRRRFDDGSEVTGSCAGARAAGDWHALDAGRAERWQAHFDGTGEHEVGVWIERRTAPSGAMFTTTIEHDVATGDKLVTSRLDERRCHKPAGDSTVSWYQRDVDDPTREVSLTVPGGTLVCTLRQVINLQIPTECRTGLRRLGGDAAVDVYTGLLDAQRAIENCLDAAMPELPACGDGVQNTGEQCDDGGASARCTEGCTLSRCGDGILNRVAGEQCDGGAGGETATCDRDCTKAGCGDGVVNAAAGEECDAGRPSHTCSAACKRVTR